MNPYPQQNQNKYPQQNQNKYPQQQNQNNYNNSNPNMYNNPSPNNYNQNPYQNNSSPNMYNQNTNINPMKLFIQNYADNLFRKYDANGSGMMDVREIYPPICELYGAYGSNPPPYNQVLFMMNSFDHDQNGLLDINEFRKLLFMLNNIPY